MRYFTSLVTGRPLNVGGRSFIFEPVEPMGGSWLGVLTVDDESAASILAAATEAASEITEAEYDRLKKKRQAQGTQPDLTPSRTPQPPPLPLVAGASHAERPTNSIGADPASAAAETVASISLLTTSKQPPPEPLLDTAPVKRRKAA